MRTNDGLASVHGGMVKKRGVKYDASRVITPLINSSEHAALKSSLRCITCSTMSFCQKDIVEL